jgi:Uma2 family endonuclease
VAGVAEVKELRLGIVQVGRLGRYVRMGMMPVAYRDWLEMPVVEDATEEVIDGEIILIPPRRLPHASILGNLCWALVRQLPESEYHVLVGNFGLVVSEEPLVCRNPDLVVYRGDSFVEKDGYFRSAPLLAVEDPDPADSRVRIERKLQDYSSIGTPEVWVLNPREQSVEVFYLQNGGLISAAVVKDGVLKPRGFPHVQIDIAQIWPD